jgi:CDP-2,3-bis-(O-geranylgeranyl)-sn-glycerol synthase
MQFGLWSLTGDLLSSFTKRRLSIAPSGRAPGIDQVPEALLPLLVLRDSLGLDGPAIIATVALFIGGGLALSQALFHAGVRDRPY